MTRGSYYGGGHALWTLSVDRFLSEGKLRFFRKACSPQGAQPITVLCDFLATDVKGFVSREASSAPARAA
jgi:hypothetical protein